MKVGLYLNKTVDENASIYFAEGKKARKKLKGAKNTLETFQEKKESTKNIETDFTSKIKKIDDSKKHWFEKFKWFISSEGFLVIAGRDATTNEIIIKKHTSPSDLVFHTDMSGSPFVVIKHDKEDVIRLFGDEFVNNLVTKQKEKYAEFDGKLKHFQDFGQQTIFEAASFTAIHSKAWKSGYGSLKVFYVKPQQVTKEANTGEYMSKGSFMIRGETTYVEPDMSFALGLVNSRDSVLVMGGPLFAVDNICENIIKIEQGTEKSSNIASHVRNFMKLKEELDVTPDAVIRVLPSGGCQIKKERKRKHEL